MRALEDLRLYDHLARTLHFGRTAAECHVTPSTLSRTIARLEADAGARLFERDRRSVALTPDGIRFLEFVHASLAEWERFAEPDEHPDGAVVGSVSIFCTVTASQTLVPTALDRFRQAYPAVHLAIETGYAADALERLSTPTGGVDVSIAAMPARRPRQVLSHVIATSAMVLVTSADSSIHLSPSVSPEWSTLPWVLPAGGLARTLVDRWFRRMRVRPTIAAEATGHEAILTLVSLGCGVGIVPDLVARQGPLVHRLRVLPMPAPAVTFDIAACTTPERLQHRPTRALWQSLTADATPGESTR
ncbi:MAG TPA: HTH-type transcriptional activator IlvY [Mycobacteriales bacterium]|nr:HTH-type transcriptional activator IlvY [Mycobacteriales bacterium]